MLFANQEFDHESVHFGHDRLTGLKTIVAIHNTFRGPAIGGCRMMAYADEASAIKDVLRLSRGMTYKCAIGDIPFGGGKAVIIADPNKDKSSELLHAMGEFVDRLGGLYITSFDAGTTLEDVRIIGERTAHVGGIQPGAGNASKSTAYGVFVCMQRAAKLRFGAESLAGMTVAIQGAGNVGARLAKLVSADGGRPIIADKQVGKALQIAQALGADTISPEEVLSAKVDVLAPCALGAVISMQTIPDLACGIVCGGANNQLATDDDAEALRTKEILYCPDYLANAGGIIDLHYQLNEPTRESLHDHLMSLSDTLSDCYSYASKHDCSMLAATNRVAEARFTRAPASD